MLIFKFVCIELNLLLWVYHSLSAEHSTRRQCPNTDVFSTFNISPGCPVTVLVLIPGARLPPMLRFFRLNPGKFQSNCLHIPNYK